MLRKRIVINSRTIMNYFLILFVCLTSISTCYGNFMGNECDWTGSGLLSPDHGRGVTPVYLRCAAGRVTWLYPRGALRILLRFPAKDREFRACIRIHSSPNPVNKYAKKSSSFPARLFLEGPRSLLPLYAENDGGSAVRCFQSKNGQAAIYVEAVDADDIKRRVADIEYDLELMPRGKGYDPAEECRPCTGEELAQAFCTSDLVTRGVIRAVDNNEDRDISEMQIKITKLIRHTTDDGYYSDVETNQIEPNFVDDPPEDITLQVARHCGVSHGSGEFVFMARRKLGNLTLKCAPRLSDWTVMMKTLTDEGKTHCVLRS